MAISGKFICVCALLLGVWTYAQDTSQNTGESPFDWMGFDSFDEVMDRMDAVNAGNCQSKPKEDLHLPEDSLAQMPRFNKLLSTIIYPNRTNLLHLHNMALNRAFYYSYIFQKLNDSADFSKQPGLMYYYFSTSADVSANEYNINGSAIIFDNNATFANWYDDLPFNTTLPLFGPRAWRFDDYNDATNWLREPTNKTIDIIDYGAGPQNNYTQSSYKVNEWYNMWLPDGWDKAGLDSVRKHSYDVGIKYSNETGRFTSDEFETKVFFGPPSPGQNEQVHIPVTFTQPYFDCGRSNKWIVSAVSPIVDQIPRYLSWFHLRRFMFVAVATQDIDFLSIDFNPCPFSIGNEPPNMFAGTARCKPSTMCEPLYGWGYRRGGYQCVCKPGYRYPPWQKGPFKGGDIESATTDEYDDGFDCYSVQLRQVIPIIRGNETAGTPTYNTRRKRALDINKTQQKQSPNMRWENTHYQPEWVRETYVKPNELKESLYSRMQRKRDRMMKEYTTRRQAETAEEEGRTHLVSSRKNSHTKESKAKKKTKFTSRESKEKVKSRHKRGAAFDSEAWHRMQDIILHKESVDKANCHTFKPEELRLPGDVSYGVEKIFSFQARTALRLSHFLSNFLQNIDRYEEYGNLAGDKFLNVEQLFGEVIANVMGDLKIKGSGIFYDIDKFVGPDGRTRQFFGPFAYRYGDGATGDTPNGQRANTQFRAVDYAGYPEHYLDRNWFKTVKERWQSNTYGLTKFTEKPMIRSDTNGTSLKKFEMYPMYYQAPSEEDGWWSMPYFDCDGFLQDWVITYSIPFFGVNSIGSSLEFKGVVKVDIRLDELDIEQCPQEYYVPNAFKATARCHYNSTFCEHLPGKRFVKGAYKCECRQGFEYPFNDRAWYFDGQTIEEEYRKRLNGTTSRYDTLVCRIAGAARAASSWFVFLLLVITVLLSRRS